VTRFAVQLLDALFPTSCVNCAATGSLFCETCRATLRFECTRTTRTDLVGYRAYEFVRPIDSVIIGFKDQGRTALAGYLSRQLAKVLEQTPFENFKLVPVPTSARSYRRRGFDPNFSVLRRLPPTYPTARCLRLARQTGDQRGLSVTGRIDNLAGSMVATREQVPLVIYDDVVTTGATLLEARRALEQAGNRVLGFVTIAEATLKHT